METVFIQATVCLVHQSAVYRQLAPDVRQHIGNVPSALTIGSRYVLASIRNHSHVNFWSIEAWAGFLQEALEFRSLEIAVTEGSCLYACVTL